MTKARKRGAACAMQLRMTKVIAAALLSCSMAAYAASDFVVSLAAFGGVRHGAAIEQLLEKDSDGIFKRKSELLWEFDSCYYLGGTADVCWNVLHATAYAAGFLPKQSGNMYDSDWMNLDSVKNDYSISENAIGRGSFFTGGHIGAEFPLLRWLRIEPHIALEYEYFYFNARNGYGWYGDWRYSATKKDVPWNSPYAQAIPAGRLYGIDYDRETLFTWTGLSLHFLPLHALETGISVLAAPFVYFDSIDHHHDRDGGHFYYDELFGIFKAGRLNCFVQLNISHCFAVRTAVGFTKIWECEGRTLHSTSKSGPYAETRNYHSGGAAEYADISLALVYTIRSSKLSARFRKH